MAGKIDGNIDNLYYQIIREDNGYESGRKKLNSRISEDLPLVKNAYNFFKFIVLDEKNNVVETDVELIGIAHGKYPIGGQPISHDICIERDSLEDLEINSTKLDCYFQKGTLLPQKVTKSFFLNKSILKGGNEKFIINVLEGPQTALPEANQTIGYIEINGSKVNRDLVRNAEIEITIEMSQSRDLKVTVYIPMSDQQFTVPFNGLLKDVPIAKLQDDVQTLSAKLITEINEAVVREEYETAERLTDLRKKVDELVINCNNLTSDDVTVTKYPFEVTKRKIAQEMDDATKDKRISILKIKYKEEKEWCKGIVEENGNDHDHKIFGEIVGREPSFLNSIIPIKILEAIDEINELAINILWRTPSFLEARFYRLLEKPQLFNDQNQAKSLIEAGNFAITNKNYDRLKEINWGLISLLPNVNQENAKTGKIGF